MKTKPEVIKELKKELPKIENLYKSKCVNWKGKIKGTGELYSEIISKELLQNIGKYDKLLRISREASYYTKSHSIIQTNNTNRYEDNFAKQITGLKLEGLGVIIDYQVPLKNKRDDKVGKIDLISFNEETNILYLIELKFGNNNETLLRAILESYTYFKVVDTSKLINDYYNAIIKMSNEFTPKEIQIKPAVLVISDCNALKELREIKEGKRSNLRELIVKLEVDCFTGSFEFKMSNTKMEHLL